MIFLDSGFLVAYVNQDDLLHQQAIPTMDDALRGKYGKIITSNFIVDEALTLARVRTKACDCSRAINELLSTEKDGKRIFFEVIVDQAIMKETTKKFLRYCEEGLSCTDCSILAIIEFLNIPFLATFDSHFKGLTTVLPAPFHAKD